MSKDFLIYRLEEIRELLSSTEDDAAEAIDQLVADLKKKKKNK